MVLAAGYSKRFQSDKRQALLTSGNTLLDATLKNIPASFHKRVLVLHPGDEELEKRYQDNWTLCIAREAAKGLGHSLAAAVPLIQNWQAVVIALADMPFVQSSTYHAIQQALNTYGIVRPRCQGRSGNPVGFQSRYFAELAKLRGDKGARELLQQHATEIHFLDCKDWGIIKDIDTAEELKGE